MALRPQLDSAKVRTTIEIDIEEYRKILHPLSIGGLKKPVPKKIKEGSDGTIRSLLEKCVEKSTLIIIDVDMIITDILFRTNNREPSALYTYDSKNLLSSSDIKTLEESAYMDAGNFFHDKNFYDNGSLVKTAELSKLLRAIIRIADDGRNSKVVFFTHVNKKTCVTNLQGKLDLVEQAVEEMDIGHMYIGTEFICSDIPKIDVFKEKYSKYYTLSGFIDDATTTCESVCEYIINEEDLKHERFLYAAPSRLIWVDKLHTVCDGHGISFLNY